MSEQWDDVSSWHGDDLPEGQWRAIVLEITGGMTFEEIARTVGVARETYWRWRKGPAYRAARRWLRMRLHQRRIDRFWALQDLAMDVAKESLDEGDPQMAIDLLKLGARGMTDIDEVRDNGDADGDTDGEDRAALDKAADTLQCVDCGFRAKSAGGLVTHRRFKHGK